MSYISETLRAKVTEKIDFVKGEILRLSNEIDSSRNTIEILKNQIIALSALQASFEMTIHGRDEVGKEIVTEILLETGASQDDIAKLFPEGESPYVNSSGQNIYDLVNSMNYQRDIETQHYYALYNEKNKNENILGALQGMENPMSAAIVALYFHDTGMSSEYISQVFPSFVPPTAPEPEPTPEPLQ